MKVEVVPTITTKPGPPYPYLAERNGRLVLVGREAVIYLDTGDGGCHPRTSYLAKDFGFTVKLIQE